MRSKILLVCCAILMAGCSSTYYSFWNKFGYEKRDILVSRVEDARDAQDKAKEDFRTTYQKFQDLTNYKGGDLEAEYNKLNSAYESCNDRAQTVRKRVDSVDKVANDMFSEWKTELGKYENQELKRASEQKLNQTRKQYAQLITAMRASEAKMDPVLHAFQDQVLFLKHNLNAAAIGSLQTTAAGIESDVQSLIKDMETSINQANTFITQIKQEK
jgi:hypothetical protein